ncbi:MAG TPA: hypothetical protein VMV72_09840 [Verrucomicrobiae bacterium]|nr:hypothetical protein [Verrucomicrobiae bacterium]
MKARLLLLAAVVMAMAAGRAIACESCIFGRVAVLSPTTNAPSGATGLATFVPDIWATPDDVTTPGTNAPALHVTTEGLSTGTYTVVVTDAETNDYTLGTFTVTAVTEYPPPVGRGHAIPEWVRLVDVGGGNFDLPSGLASSNVVGISISDTNDLVDLTGTFPVPPPPPPCGVREDATLAATTNAPAAASGYAQLFSGPCFLPLGCGDIMPPIFAPTIRLTVDGLPGGTYTVSITDVATNTYDLGTLNILTITNPIAACTSTVVTDKVPSMIILVGSGTFALPSGLAPTNVVGISVSDSNDVVDLTGTFGAQPPPPRVVREFIVLGDTTNAPSGAMGRAAMVGQITSSTNTVNVKVETLGLLAGTYTTSIADQTGTNFFTLGTFDVSVRTNVFPCAAKASLVPFGSNTVGGGSFPLPSGLDPTNVTTISISDTNGLADLTGDFTNAVHRFPCVFDTLVPLGPGPLCTNLTGSARLYVCATKGKTHGGLSLVAAGCPPKSTLHVFVNGSEVGTVKSDRRGHVTINRLPKGTDYAGVSTLAAQDADGNVAFSVNF